MHFFFCATELNFLIPKKNSSLAVTSICTILIKTGRRGHTSYLKLQGHIKLRIFLREGYLADVVKRESVGGGGTMKAVKPEKKTI